MQSGTEYASTKKPLDRLVVDAVHAAGGATATGAGERRVGHHFDVVEMLIEGLGVDVPAVAALRGDVLIQRTAERHVDELQPATDAEHRPAGLDEAAQQRQFVRVADAVAFPVRAQRRFAIRCRTHVGAALEHQAIERRDVLRDAQIFGANHATRLDRGHHEDQRVAAHEPLRDGMFEVLQLLALEAQLGGHAVQEARRQTDAQRRTGRAGIAGVGHSGTLGTAASASWFSGHGKALRSRPIAAWRKVSTQQKMS